MAQPEKIAATDVVAINKRKREAILDNGSVVALTLLDIDGDETTDEDIAIGFVCGEDATWFQGWLDDYKPLTVFH